MIRQPVDPLSDGHVANDGAVNTCWGWSQLSYHGISLDGSNIHNIACTQLVDRLA